ncbi:hemerythrin domain-containing protein [Noviherbaspirillum autotrophicum]|uniref:hemerythrin domain-containing protein n=1 Tax=Noviherbaspirillum autotrophicum TaxID=709839 RepID=UPI0006940F25|nr:hemerythrin domain-containing protein [Noviherbaspirillum autotrophicum]
MSRTEKFRQQHNEILALATELQAMLNEGALAKDGLPARSCLAKLMGKLSLHLSSEDKVLYPELEAHKDANVAGVARRFSAEMKKTTAEISAYNSRWPTPTSIKTNPQSFVKETKEVIKVLADRIKRENQELYAVADRA